MNYFITGSTGFIGMELTRHLIAEGHSVNLLVRDPQKAINHPSVRLFQGDLEDAAIIEKAMEDCTHVFHLAAYAKAFADDPDIFTRVNVEGTRNILEAALRLKVQRVVFTSTAGTFDPTTDDNDAHEASARSGKFDAGYAISKWQAEQVCQQYINRGLDIVIVYPSRVFGPGAINDSNAVTKIIKLYFSGKWHYIPGNGKTIGNYVFIDDVVNGLYLAMHKGKMGEGYILGGNNVSFNEFFSTLKNASGLKHFLFRIPFPLLWMASWLMVVIGKVFKTKVLISPAWVRRYLQHRRLSSQKAVNELGYSVTPLQEGISKTINWLKKEQNQHYSEYYTLITGASSGIGKALSEECAQRGMNLFLVSLPNTGLPEIASELCSRYGIHCAVLEMDLQQQGSHHKVYEFARERGLKVNVLINNVGTGFNGKLETMSEYEISNMLMLNMVATTLLTQLFLPDLRTAPKSHILNFSSLAAFLPLPGKCVYAASKAYVMYLTRALRRELRGSSVNVSGVFPAGVPTNKLVLERIRRSTKLAQSLTSSVEQVAREGIDGMLKNKAVIFPGRKLKSFVFTFSVVPQGFMLYLAEKEFRAAPDAR
jgi:NAD+-dependent farnesol dehydrogenase